MTSKILITFPENSLRPETGSCYADGDWPGVFIRGDNAFYYSEVISKVLDLMKNKKDKQLSYYELHLTELKCLLDSCIQK